MRSSSKRQRKHGSPRRGSPGACDRPDADTRPACEVACPQMVKVLCLSRYKEDRPNWSLKAFMLALGRLGGHQNRKSDGMPGWLTLWRGWQALQAIIQGYRLHSKQLQCGVT